MTDEKLIAELDGALEVCRNADGRQEVLRSRSRSMYQIIKRQQAKIERLEGGKVSVSDIANILDAHGMFYEKSNEAAQTICDLINKEK